MPKVIRILADPSQGHCFPPLPALNGSNDVFVNGLSVVRATDDYGQIHSCGSTSHAMGLAIHGSQTVLVNGLGIHRDGDGISCGDAADNGSPNVFADGGGGTIGPTAPTGITESTLPPEHPAFSVSAETIGYTVFPPKVIYDTPLIAARVETQIGGIFIGGCPVNFVPEIYTPVIEEFTGFEFKNKVVPVSGLQLYTGFPYQNLPQGLVFDPLTGVISGAVNSFTTPGITKHAVLATNYVGTT